MQGAVSLRPAVIGALPARARAAAWAILPTAALLTLNGFYLGAAFRASEALFWLLDLLQFVLVPLASVWALGRLAGVRPRHYGLGALRGGDGPFMAAATYVLVVVAYVFGYGLAKILALMLPWEWPATAFFYTRAIPTDPLAALVVLVYLSLTAAFVEEIMYRGLPALVFPPSIYPLVSGAAFALIHWEGGTREVVATFLLGTVLASLYLRIRNLWPFVAAHAVTDMLAFTGTYGY
jgi:membrane protease YdiL (CAAX protease family)